MNLPPDAREDELYADGDAMCGPSGRVFGRCHRRGISGTARHTLASAVANGAPCVDGLAPCLLRVLGAVSANEGGFDAVNTWDSSVLSFGLLQWSVGAGNAAGELGGLLSRLQRESPEAFHAHFGRHGLGVEGPTPRAHALHYCHLSLHGERLDTAQAKAALRAPVWAWRFWRAGHDDRVHRCQVEHGAARLAVYYARPREALRGRTLASVLRSELGVALLFDQHTNRPGHVPATLLAALRGCIEEGLVPAETETWTTREEALLLARYLLARHATSMTDGRARAARMMAAVGRGELSAERGSFTASGRLRD